MPVPIQQVSKTLAEFYPDWEVRWKLHRGFVDQFLVSYVNERPFDLMLHDGVDPTIYLQATWATLEQIKGLVPATPGPDGRLLIRRVTDLQAWTQDVAGCPAFFIQMPLPEMFCCAFFAAEVLLVQADAFHALERTYLNYRRAGNGPDPAEADLAPFRGVKIRFFTLEVSYPSTGELALDTGYFCELTFTKSPRSLTHRLLGMGVPSNRGKFADAVGAVLQRDGPPPAVAVPQRHAQSPPACVSFTTSPISAPTAKPQPPRSKQTGGDAGQSAV